MWYQNIKDALTEIGLQYLTTGGQNTGNKHSTYFRRILDIFYQDSFAEINKENSKLRTYKLFKTSSEMESYITEIKNEKDRIDFSKFRLSNHKLMIEIRRHNGIEKEFRFSKFCPDIIEDEIHFITCCKTFKKQREKLIAEIRQRNICLNFRGVDRKTLFVFFMGNDDLAP